jgi:hypothetical protein
MARVFRCMTIEQLLNPEERLTPFSSWLRGLGLSKATGWRWRQTGVVRALNINGRLYLSNAEIRRFNERASAGEFARKCDALMNK